MQEHLENLRALASRHGGAGTVETVLPGVAITIARQTTQPFIGMFQPRCCLVLQGAKEVTIGERRMRYDPNNYFSPDRRYASDKSAGGPTREFKSLVKALHDQGIKVYVDMVYNHTGEGGVSSDGSTAPVRSWRGLDNAAYYLLWKGDRRYYTQVAAVPGAPVNAAHPVMRQQILDALAYWKEVLGVDGFRFDLAPVLGNNVLEGGFEFDKLDPQNVLNRAVRELPVRPDGGGDGVDLIAEPWGGAQAQGQFPSGWAEWNDAFRNAFRKSQNKLGVENVSPGELAARFAGSSDWFQDDGRKPWHSVNFLVAHDGFSLRDLYAYNTKQNGQAWPKGPSDGGSDDNKSWDQGGSPPLQRQAARTGLALLMVSAGVPMISGGDEMYRTQFGNNNPYNVDSAAMHLNFQDAQTFPRHFAFSQKLFAFRQAHAALRPANFFRGQDGNQNGLKDITGSIDLFSGSLSFP
jgi:glycogen operon protein